MLVGVIVGVLLVVISVATLLFARRNRRKSPSTGFDSVELKAPANETSSKKSSIGKKQWNIPYKELKIQEQIGKGGFGVVYKVSPINALI